MTDLTKNSNEYWLTKAQYEARKTAGTLVVGAIYHITDDVDTTPTSNSSNLITSGGVYDYHDASKLDRNSTIVGSTKCKISYDTNGLVIAGSNLTQSDITTALGYTPYNNTNPNNYITKSVDDLTNYTLTSNLADVALSNSYNDLDDKPTIPTNTNQLTNGSGYITKSVNNLTYYTPTSSLASVATSGSYTDLSNKPTIPSVINNVTSTDTNNSLSAYQGKLLNDRLDNISNIGRFLALWNCVTGLPLTNPSGYPYTYKTGDYFRISNVGQTNYMPEGSSYQGVASTTTYSGEVAVADIWFYDGTEWQLQLNHAIDTGVMEVNVNGSSVVTDHVANISVPSVNNATLTIQKNGTNVSTFTANASTDVTCNISVPTDTNELTNGAGYITNSVNNLTNYTLTSSLSSVATSGDYDDLSNTPSIPSTPQLRFYTLFSDGWSDNQNTKSDAWFSTSYCYIIAPVSTYFNDYCSAGIYASSIVNGSITFTCATTPTTDIQVQLIRLEAI